MCLPENDPWRKRGDRFNGEDELEVPPLKRSGKEIDTLLKSWKHCPPLGKIKKQKRKRGEKKKEKELRPLMGVWKRRSMFFDLLYWKFLGTPHSLDVMHITKNVCEILLATLFNMPDRTKDGPKARHDLKAPNIREELPLVENRPFVLPFHPGHGPDHDQRSGHVALKPAVAYGPFCPGSLGHFSPGLCHQPGQKGYATRCSLVPPLVPVGDKNWD